MEPAVQVAPAAVLAKVIGEDLVNAANAGESVAHKLKKEITPQRLVTTLKQRKE